MFQSIAPWLLLLSTVVVTLPTTIQSVRSEETRTEYTTRMSLEAEANRYLERGNDLFDREDYQGAIAQYDRAVDIVPYLAEAYYNRSQIKTTLKDTQGAILDLTWTLAVKPNHFRAYYDRGLLESKIGDRQQALKDFNSAIALRTDWAEAYIQRSQIQRDLGQRLAAIESLQQATRLLQQEGDSIAYQQAARLLAQIQLEAKGNQLSRR